MINIHDYITDHKCFKTFKVDDLLFVEYKCLFEAHTVSYWTHNNYFTYILGGTTRYINGEREYIVRKGDALFVRKGTYIADRHGKGEYCALIIFVPDDFIRTILGKYPFSSSLKNATSSPESNSIFPLNVDESLTAYFHSVLSYFSGDVSPSRELLKIKFEELLLNILHGQQDPSLVACLRGIREGGKVSIRDVMETSFMHPMSLEEYARLCGRSLSAFKSDFYDVYKTSPGKWLIHARLQFAKVLMETTGESVNDIADKTGFKNTAHFVKTFKATYGMPPLQYRLSKANSSHLEPVA